MNVEAVDFRDELRQRVQLGLDLSPVILRLPVAREFLNRRQLYALRRIPDRFHIGPSRCRDAAAEVDQRIFRKTYLKWADRVACRCCAR